MDRVTITKSFPVSRRQSEIPFTRCSIFAFRDSIPKLLGRMAISKCGRKLLLNKDHSVSNPYASTLSFRQGKECYLGAHRKLFHQWLANFREGPVATSWEFEGREKIQQWKGAMATRQHVMSVRFLAKSLIACRRLPIISMIFEMWLIITASNPYDTIKLDESSIQRPRFWVGCGPVDFSEILVPRPLI